jgi:hypothetical protein
MLPGCQMRLDHENGVAGSKEVYSNVMPNGRHGCSDFESLTARARLVLRISELTRSLRLCWAF